MLHLHPVASPVCVAVLLLSANCFWPTPDWSGWPAVRCVVGVLEKGIPASLVSSGSLSDRRSTWLQRYRSSLNGVCDSEAELSVTFSSIIFCLGEV